MRLAPRARARTSHLSAPCVPRPDHRPARACSPDPRATVARHTPPDSRDLTCREAREREKRGEEKRARLTKSISLMPSATSNVLTVIVVAVHVGRWYLCRGERRARETRGLTRGVVRTVGARAPIFVSGAPLNLSPRLSQRGGRSRPGRDGSRGFEIVSGISVFQRLKR